jgi:hypothetical protein
MRHTTPSWGTFVLQFSLSLKNEKDMDRTNPDEWTRGHTYTKLYAKSDDSVELTSSGRDNKLYQLKIWRKCDPSEALIC